MKPFGCSKFFSKNFELIMTIAVLIAVEHPADAELISKHTEQCPPECFFKFMGDVSVDCQVLKLGAHLFFAAAVQAQGYIVSMDESLGAYHIRSHEFYFIVHKTGMQYLFLYMRRHLCRHR
jgi:hypothetical protein